MRDFLITLDTSKGNKVQALCEGLRIAIREGRIRPGERLPSSRDMARQLGMHRQTVMTALSELEAEGWIQSNARRFYNVIETLPDTFLRPRSSKNALRMKFVEEKFPGFARPIQLPDPPSLSSHKFSFPSGLPDLRLFPMKEFKSHLYDALQEKNVLSYGPPAGHPQLVEQIGEYLRRVRSVDSRKIIVTNGSQEAIFLLAQCLIGPGDKVGVEALGYPPAMEAMKFAGAQLIPIEVDAEGMSMDDLENKLKRHKLKFIYVTPLHQYPTTVTLSASRRLRLYELALEHGIYLIEDDYDHEFHYRGQPVAPLASFDPAGIVLYMSTFSKVLFPSARVGFLSLPPKIGEQLERLKRISSRQNEHILQAAIALWMKSGEMEKHIRKMRRINEERFRHFLGQLKVLQKEHGGIDWIEPDGGMALWLDLGRNTTRLAKLLGQSSILLFPESQYRLDQRPGTHVRVGFTTHTPQETDLALKALFGHLKKI